jgi:ligand-binding sensor domain-containing protein/signal transduction histidine kinase
MLRSLCKLEQRPLLRECNTFRKAQTRKRCSSQWLLTAIIALFFVYPVYALDPHRAVSQYIHDSWSYEKGFPGGSVNGIAQSSDGYLWIGTDNGLYRFDGINFVDVEKLYPSLSPVPHVLGLVTDAEGDLWVRLQGPEVLHYRNKNFEALALKTVGSAGVTAFSRGSREILFSTLVHTDGMVAQRYRNGAFETFTASTLPPNFLVLSIAETSDRKIWLGTDDGLFYLSRGQLVPVIEGLPDRKINSLLPIQDGRLWIGTDHGAVLWDGVRIAVNQVSFPQIQVFTMEQDRDGNLWFGTARGLMRLNSAGVSWLEESQNEKGAETTALLEDREGNLWIGNANGLERLRNSTFVTYSASKGLPSDSYGPIYVDSDDRSWMAPMEGGLYWMRSGKVGRITDDGLERDIVYSITGGKDEVWVGRQRGGLTRLVFRGDKFTATTYTQNDGLAQNSVFAVHRSRDGTVWAGTLSGGVSRFKDGRFTTYAMADGLASNTVSSIEEGVDGSIWFATKDGLTLLSNNHWKTYGVADGLPSDDVICLLTDSAGVLWIGTAGGLVSLRSGKIYSTNMADSLREPILGLATDKYESLWIATSSHVLKVNRDNLLQGILSGNDIREYSLVDGLYGTDGVRRDRSVVKDEGGRIWFSLNRGISVVDPIQATGKSAPAIAHIEAIVADGTPVQMQAPVHIPGATQRITFDYTGLSFAAPERVRFRYRLDGFDRDWNEPVTTRQAVYTNLGPGFYRFRVASSNSEGEWNGSEAQIPFRIEPVFWQSWWFQLTCALALALTVWLLYRIRMHQKIAQLNVRFDERLRERTRIAQDLHDTLLQGILSASMHLHVASNRLSDDSPAKPLLIQVQQLMDQVINEGRTALQGLRSLSGDPRKLEQAFSRIPQELGDQQEIAYRVIVEGSPRPLHPVIRDEVYRIGREALVNAFRHATAGRIEIQVEYTAAHLRVAVRDDGCGIDPRVLHVGREGHWGLSGMRERAERIGAKLKLRSRIDAGTEIELIVPHDVAYQQQSQNSRVS